MPQLGKVHFKHIRLDHFELSMAAQPCCQIAVKFDHRQLPKTLDQRLRQSSQTRANFHHRLAGHGGDSTHDGVDDGVVTQKMLTKALARNVLHPGSAPGYCGGSRSST